MRSKGVLVASKATSGLSKPRTRERRRCGRRSPDRRAQRTDVRTHVDRVGSADVKVVMQAGDTAGIANSELRSFRFADLIVEARDGSGESCYMAVEISFTANGRDTSRAIRNAEFLKRFTSRPGVCGGSRLAPRRPYLGSARNGCGRLVPTGSASVGSGIAPATEATSHAERRGLFVIRVTGSSASITNRDDFTPRVFGP